ncbi:DoxX family protein [Aquibacillus sediminis]|uniref:DoxX family protein n=1 Tax=Aquibacillus sediminis TaxID=2574734 RepID=UPI001109B4D1|nr:DoxX family protein [Aquibacillus sediminis]
MLNMLRNNNVVAGVLAIIRIYLGYSWITSGWGKVTGGGFDASGFIQGAVANSKGEEATVQAWWGAFLETFALPNADLFTFMVMWGEVLVGAGLIVGLFTNFAVLMGLVMNFSFLLSGTVSTNAQMVVLGMFVLVAGANAGKFGLDRYAMPYLKGLFTNKTDKKVQETVEA